MSAMSYARRRLIRSVRRFIARHPMNSSRSVVAIVSFVLCTLFAWENQVRACSCTGALPPIQEMTEASAVFTGKVIKLTKLGTSEKYLDFFTGYDVTIQVSVVIKGKALKNKVGSNVTIHTGAGGGDCGFDFEEGKEYLVYAYGNALKLGTNICTRTSLLEETGEEVLELQGKLPKIPLAPHPPELALKGTINDAGYHGYVFELRNYLHQRIFYSRPHAQVLRDGKWEDYPMNYGIEPRKEPKTEDVAKLLIEERTRDAQEEAERRGLRGIPYLSRMSASPGFVAMQSQSLPWRVGFQYELESVVIAGKKLSKSRRFVWGPQIDASVETKKLSFEEAFKGSGMIPNPLGTESTKPSTDQK